MHVIDIDLNSDKIHMFNNKKNESGIKKMPKRRTM